MSMLTMNGIVQNVFDTPAKPDKKTGEIYPASSRVQLLCENIQENGQKKMELVTLKVEKPDFYRKNTGQFVSVPVGAMGEGNAKIIYWSLKNEQAQVPAAAVKAA